MENSVFWLRTPKFSKCCRLSRMFIKNIYRTYYTKYILHSEEIVFKLHKVYGSMLFWTRTTSTLQVSDNLISLKQSHNLSTLVANLQMRKNNYRPITSPFLTCREWMSVYTCACCPWHDCVEVKIQLRSHTTDCLIVLPSTTENERKLPTVLMFLSMVLAALF